MVPDPIRRKLNWEWPQTLRELGILAVAVTDEGGRGCLLFLLNRVEGEPSASIRIGLERRKSRTNLAVLTEISQSRSLPAGYVFRERIALNDTQRVELTSSKCRFPEQRWRCRRAVLRSCYEKHRTKNIAK